MTAPYLAYLSRFVDDGEDKVIRKKQLAIWCFSSMRRHVTQCGEIRRLHVQGKYDGWVKKNR